MARANVVEHPTKTRRFKAAAERWLKTRDGARVAHEYMWVGLVMSRFTDAELKMLNAEGYLSDNDRTLLKRAGRSLS